MVVIEKVGEKLEIYSSPSSSVWVIAIILDLLIFASLAYLISRQERNSDIKRPKN